MHLNLFQVLSISIVLVLLLVIWCKYGISFVFNYLIGFIFIVFYDLIFNEKGGAIYLVINLIFYNILFASSFYVNFIEEDNRKEKFFVIPKLLYIIFLFIELFLVDPFEYLLYKFSISLFPIFIAFFSFYILLYRKKYKNND